MVGVKDQLIRIEHQFLGKHDLTSFVTRARDIGSLAYSGVDNVVFVADRATNTVFGVDLDTGFGTTLHIGNGMERITSLAFDDHGNNLYWCDTGRTTVEVISVNTMSRTTLVDNVSVGETPVAVAVAPAYGVMFVAFRKADGEVHIDRFRMDGTGRTHVIEDGLMGEISLTFDGDLHRVFWSDSVTGNIESTSIDGDDRHGFRSLQTAPLALASLKKDLFWTNAKSRRLFWADKENKSAYNKRITLDIPDVDFDALRLVSITAGEKVPRHPCREGANGNCSHLCLVTGGGEYSCRCPLGMELGSDYRTCEKRKSCRASEFYCPKSDVCVPDEMRCNGRTDCLHREDETGCEARCPQRGQFGCKNGIGCVERERVCDSKYDCADRYVKLNYF